MSKLSILLTGQFLLLAPAIGTASDSDWPTYRYDAARSAATPHVLPETLHLRWTLTLPPGQPAWPASQFKLQFDAGYEPVCADGKLLIGSNVDSTVTAFDVADGKLLWRYFTDGPVRFAPAIDNGRVYVVSDDGCLHCLDLKTGARNWVVRGGPSGQRIIGNGHLTSMWPARGGVVVHNGAAYFAAGIWPSMGIFVKAVNSVTGEVLWNNSTTGSLFVTHPHGAKSFGSISPQGYLAISGDNLLVPGGRTLPGVFDLATGELRHFEFGGKGEGGFRVVTSGDYYFVRGEMRRTADGRDVGRLDAAVVGPSGILSADGSNIVLTSTHGSLKERTVKDRRGKETQVTSFEAENVSRFPVDGPAHVVLQAGRRVFAADAGRIAAYEAQRGGVALKLWSTEVDGDVWSMIAAGEHLFVTTKQGQIHCFGASPFSADDPSRVHLVKPQRRAFSQVADAALSKPHNETAAQLAGLASKLRGYAVSIGAPDDRTLQSLMDVSDLSVVAVSPDEDAIGQFRREAVQDDRFGVRVAALVADISRNELPAYFASFVFCEASRDWDQAQIASVFDILRPYGGLCCLHTTDEQHTAIQSSIAAGDFYGAETSRQGTWTLLRRVGPLQNAGVWTHQYGDAGSSSVSADARVRTPLGMLWFGGPSNDKVLPRHGHGPTPQVAGGRLFIEGPDMLRCVDVYTGRVWWEREFSGVGTFYNNTSHHPGAGEIGSNYVSLEDHVYLIHGPKLLALDAQTGLTVREFQPLSDHRQITSWGALRVEGDVLIAAASPVTVPAAEKKADPADESTVTPTDELPKAALADVLQAARYSSASRTLVAFNRHSGEVLWSRNASSNFRHNAICAAEETVYCIDAMSANKLAALKRRGVKLKGKARLLALDAHSGKIIWNTTDDVFGTFLSYSREYDVLLEGGSAYRDRASDEVSTGLVARRGRTGELIWKDRKRQYGGPCLLHGDRIITNGGGGFEIELLTGKSTGWKYSRMYGCNTAIGSRHLLTFRSGAAGFCDLAGDSGTGNFGGFRSSCTSNLIVADGVLNAPDYTRTCSCAYQLQTSLALVHMPQVETWTFGHEEYTNKPVRNLGVNLGAPGDRRDADGLLWFDFPAVGGPSPQLSIKTEPPNPEQFAEHSALLPSGSRNWVGASGFRGLRRLMLKADVPDGVKAVSVRFVFCEPDRMQPGQRVFSVSINGEIVLPQVDIASEAMSPHGTVTHDVQDVAFDGTLEVRLHSLADSAPPVLSGIAVMAD